MTALNNGQLVYLSGSKEGEEVAMKRLLALFLSVLFSVSNNVDFQASSDEDFVVNGYYMLNENAPPDYRYVYQNYSTMTSTGNCLSSSSSRTRAPLVHLEELSPYKYWFNYSETESVDVEFLDALPDKSSFTFTDSADIVAPQALVVKTKSTDGGGHSMLLESTDGKYQLYVSNMERWFCCRNRQLSAEDDPLTYTWSHTCNIHGYTIPQGYMIGKSVDGTIVSVQDANGRSVSLKDFYTN